MEQFRKIFVVMPVSAQTNRLHLQGIVDYARANTVPRWQFQLNLSDNAFQDVSVSSLTGCDGIIAKVDDMADRARYVATGLPCVFVDSVTTRRQDALREKGTVTFLNDHAAEGRAAADYFLARRYRSFAYVGSSVPTPWSEERLRGFSDRLRESGYACQAFRPSRKGERGECGRLVEWLLALPPQTALFTVHDRRAQEIVVAATSAGIDIPGRLAVLGVDNDELICSATTPAISSIAVDARHAGWLYAEALNRLFQGCRLPPTYRTRHALVVTRASTDSTAVDDPFVARALAAICRNPGADLTTASLAAEAGCSKRTLQIRLKRELGTTIADEITRLRLAEARRRLETTEDAVTEIAAECGFCGPSHLGVRLREVYGMGPREIRAAALGA